MEPQRFYSSEVVTGRLLERGTCINPIRPLPRPRLRARPSQFRSLCRPASPRATKTYRYEGNKHGRPRRPPQRRFRLATSTSSLNAVRGRRNPCVATTRVACYSAGWAMVRATAAFGPIGRVWCRRWQDCALRGGAPRECLILGSARALVGPIPVFGQSSAHSAGTAFGIALSDAFVRLIRVVSLNMPDVRQRARVVGQRPRYLPIGTNR